MSASLPIYKTAKMLTDKCEALHSSDLYKKRDVRAYFFLSFKFYKNLCIKRHNSNRPR